MGRITIVLLLFLIQDCATSHASSGHLTVSNDLPIASAIHDLCGKDVVLLGEDASHGNGKAIQFKVALVQQLVEKCHFGAFFIESGTYDFLSLNEKLSSGHPVSEKTVAAAIGGVWATTKEMQPLISFLTVLANNKTVLLGGIDDQVGAGTYAQKEMLDELTAYLGEMRRSECREIIGRYTAWTYDDIHPYDAHAVGDILQCWRDVGTELTKLRVISTPLRGIHLQMIRSLVRAFTLERALFSGASHNANVNDRDHSMYLNFQWLMSRIRRPKKVIIWTATVHAAKELETIGGPLMSRIPFGSYLHKVYQG